MTTSTVLRSPLLEALRQSPIPALRKLTIEETDDGIILGGCVSSYYLKQLAQETVIPALNGRPLSNRITVIRT